MKCFACEYENEIDFPYYTISELCLPHLEQSRISAAKAQIQDDRLLLYFCPYCGQTKFNLQHDLPQVVVKAAEKLSPKDSVELLRLAQLAQKEVSSDADLIRYLMKKVHKKTGLRYALRVLSECAEIINAQEFVTKLIMSVTHCNNDAYLKQVGVKLLNYIQHGKSLESTDKLWAELNYLSITHLGESLNKAGKQFIEVITKSNELNLDEEDNRWLHFMRIFFECAIQAEFNTKFGSPDLYVLLDYGALLLNKKDRT